MTEEEIEKETVATVKFGRILTEEEQIMVEKEIYALGFTMKKTSMDIDFYERET